MFIDLFMSIPGIPGDATATGHVGKINLTQCGWSLQKLVDPDNGRLVSALLSRFVTVGKTLDRSSPLLAQAAGMGSTLSSCEILATRVVNGTLTNFWRLQLKNARIEHYHHSNYSDVPNENLVLSYASMQVDIGTKFDGSNRYTFTP